LLVYRTLRAYARARVENFLNQRSRRERRRWGRTGEILLSGERRVGVDSITTTSPLGRCEREDGRPKPMDIEKR